MLKVVVFDRDQMHKDDYPGPEEFYADEIHTDEFGQMEFFNVKDHEIHKYHPDYFYIDIYPAEVNN